MQCTTCRLLGIKKSAVVCQRSSGQERRWDGIRVQRQDGPGTIQASSIHPSNQSPLSPDLSRASSLSSWCGVLSRLLLRFDVVRQMEFQGIQMVKLEIIKNSLNSDWHLSFCLAFPVVLLLLSPPYLELLYCYTAEIDASWFFNNSVERWFSLLGNMIRRVLRIVSKWRSPELGLFVMILSDKYSIYNKLHPRASITVLSYNFKERLRGHRKMRFSSFQLFVFISICSFRKSSLPSTPNGTIFPLKYIPCCGLNIIGFPDVPKCP